MNTTVGSLDAEKIAESVLLYAFTMAFPDKQKIIHNQNMAKVTHI